VLALLLERGTQMTGQMAGSSGGSSSFGAVTAPGGGGGQANNYEGGGPGGAGWSGGGASFHPTGDNGGFDGHTGTRQYDGVSDSVNISTLTASFYFAASFAPGAAGIGGMDTSGGDGVGGGGAGGVLISGIGPNAGTGGVASCDSSVRTKATGGSGYGSGGGGGSGCSGRGGAGASGVVFVELVCPTPAPTPVPTPQPTPLPTPVRQFVSRSATHNYLLIICM
jgi:hypothetical protein